MDVAILGCGAVGQSIGQGLAESSLISKLILADIQLNGPENVARRTKSDKITISKVDAGNLEEVATLAKQVDLLVNGATPAFNTRIMEGCLRGGACYLDMASGYEESENPTDIDPISPDHQFNQNKRWEEADLLALISMGIDPGASDIFAKGAADRMDSVDYIKVRDADTGYVEGYEFAAQFSPEAMLEEVLSDPLYWENGKWHRSPALEVSEIYDFPAPIGPQKAYRTDHEESELVPRFLGKQVGKVDFMITLNETFVSYIRMLRKLGLTNRKPIDVKGSKVVPFDVIVSTMPRPDALSGMIKGTAMVLTEVGGQMKGQDVRIRTWTYISHETAYDLCGIHATAYQTAMAPVVAIEMMARGEITAKGVKPPEVVDPVKFCGYLREKHMPVLEEIMPIEKK
jgi:saccharopine dehydrogenase (NAD+, L-lysine-forming)